MSRLQGAIAVYFVGYVMKGASPPAFIPITLLPWHSSPITAESDAYRPAEASNQIVLFSSNGLEPSEMYTITVTKTDATLEIDVNIDSFILTTPDGADSNFIFFEIQIYVLRTSLCYTLRQMWCISVAADNAMVGYEVGSFLQLPLGKEQIQYLHLPVRTFLHLHLYLHHSIILLRSSNDCH